MNKIFDYKVDLKDKNILIIMPKFYAYQAKMQEDFNVRGANVKFYDEEPGKRDYLILKNIEKFLRMKNIFKAFNRKLAERIIAEMPAEKYDYFLVIRGNVITNDTIEHIKTKALKPEAKMIYYSWDTFENMRHNGNLGRVFDKRATFDSVDVKNNPDYDLIPLFYSDEFNADQSMDIANPEYDYVSVAAFYPFRYKYFKAMKEANPDKKLCLKLYLSPTVYRGKKIKDPALVRNLDRDIVSFEPFTPEQIRNLCLNSKAIVDLALENQKGLTMRTMETLGIKRKIVTNNVHLREYEFYNEDNAVVLEDLASMDPSKFILPGREWLDKPYVENEEIRSKYSIHAWIDNLFK